MFVSYKHCRMCLNYNQHCNISQFSVNMYNPLGRAVVWPVRLPVNGSAYEVSDAKGRSVDCEV